MSNLMEATDIYWQIKGKQIRTIYFDLSNAFDTINHELLAVKLYKLGIKFDEFNFYCTKSALLRIQSPLTSS